VRRLIVAWPLVAGERCTVRTTEGWPDSWQVGGAGLVRRVGRLGNAAYAKAQVRTCSLPQGGALISPELSLLSAVQVSRKGAFNLVVCIFESKHDGPKYDALRRPGVAGTKLIAMNILGVSLDDSCTLFASAVSVNCSESDKCSDGLLEIASIARPFRIDLTYSLLIAAIGAERLILEAATENSLKIRFPALAARRHLGLLNNWLSIPSSDSTDLLRQVGLLRASLSLDERRSQVKRALEHQVRAADFATAAFIASAGLCATLLPGIFDLVGKPQVDFPILVSWVAGIALTAGMSTWWLSRQG